MKFTYTLAFLIGSTILLGACNVTTSGSQTNGQGAGANPDGTCNNDMIIATNAFKAQVDSAQNSINADKNSDGTYNNYGDLVNQVQSVKQTCGNYTSVYGTTVCTGSDLTGKPVTVNGNQISQACAAMPTVSTVCDSTYLTTYANFDTAERPINQYLNSDGTLNALGQANPNAVLAAAPDLTNKCHAFENAYPSSTSCNLTVNSATVTLNASTLYALCTELNTFARNPFDSSARLSVHEYQDTAAIVRKAISLRGVQAGVKKSGI